MTKSRYASARRMAHAPGRAKAPPRNAPPSIRHQNAANGSPTTDAASPYPKTRPGGSGYPRKRRRSSASRSETESEIAVQVCQTPKKRAATASSACLPAPERTAFQAPAPESAANTSPAGIATANSAMRATSSGTPPLPRSRLQRRRARSSMKARSGDGRRATAGGGAAPGTALTPGGPRRARRASARGRARLRPSG